LARPIYARTQAKGIFAVQEAQSPEPWSLTEQVEKLTSDGKLLITLINLV
jgi:hypothetical protein